MEPLPPIDHFNDHNCTEPDESNPPTWDKSKTGLLHSSGFWISLCALLLYAFSFWLYDGE
jgi:hypothetical protein